MSIIYKIGEIIYNTLQIENAKDKMFYSFRTTAQDREKMKRNDYNIFITQENKFTPHSKPSKTKILDLVPTVEEEANNQAFVENKYIQGYIQTIKITVLTYKNNISQQNDIATDIANKISLAFVSQASERIQDQYNFRIISNNFNYNDISIAEGIEGEIERLEMSFKVLYNISHTLKEEVVKEIAFAINII